MPLSPTNSENTLKTPRKLFSTDPQASISPALAFHSPPGEGRHLESWALETPSANPKRPLSEIKLLAPLLRDCKKKKWHSRIFLAACLVLFVAHLALSELPPATHDRHNFREKTWKLGLARREPWGPEQKGAAKLLCTEICRFDVEGRADYFCTKSFFSSRRRNYARREVSSSLNMCSHFYIHADIEWTRASRNTSWLLLQKKRSPATGRFALRKANKVLF